MHTQSNGHTNGHVNGKDHHWIDIRTVAATAQKHAAQIIPHWLPRGRREGREWVALNPTRADTTPGSFKINTTTGVWCDFATGDKGSDLVSLRAYLDGTSQIDAALRVAEELGITSSPRNAPGKKREARPQKPLGSPQPGAARCPILPAPREPALQDLRHRTHGLPTHIWPYYTADGVIHHVKARYQTPKGKTFTLWRWGGREWTGGTPGRPHPLYNLPDLIEHPDAPVLVVEGEKTADAAIKLFPTWTVVTSGSETSAETADWALLAGRRVVIWPDHDKAGARYAETVAQIATRNGAESVAIVTIPDAWPEKWDLADPLPDSITPGDLTAMLEQAKPCKPKEQPPVPEKPDSWPIPDMSLINGTQHQQPKPALSVFGELASWIETTARGKAAPVDFVVLGLLVTCSSLIGAKRWVVATNKWKEPAILWGANVANSSDGKSPAMEPLEDAIKAAEKPLQDTYTEKLREYETKAEIARAKTAYWKRQIEEAVRLGSPEPPRPEGTMEPERPMPPKIWISDTTREDVAATMANNPGGLLLYRDELAGFVGSFDSYSGHGADRAFWLETFRGRSYRVGRKSSGQINIPFCAASIFGSIQPERLHTLILDSGNDGFQARFLYVWPNPEDPIDLADTEDNDEALQTIISRLAGLTMATDAEGAPFPSHIKLTEEARQAFSDWRKGHIKAARRIPGAFGSWLGKCPGFILRIALNLEYIWWAQAPLGMPEPKTVSERAIGYALALMDDWLIPHARRVFKESAATNTDVGATELARWIADRPEGERTTFNASQVRRRARLHGIREAKEMDAACAELVEAGWIRSIGTTTKRGGRPSKSYEINPSIYKPGKAPPLAETAETAKT